MRRLLAFLLLPLAMLLSVSVAVPAHAADPIDLWKNATDPKFKYGLDYYKFLTQGGTGGTGGPVSPWPNTAPTKLPVAGSVNPSNTGGSWYLSQYQNNAKGGVRAIEASNKPLTGKIIEPGKTLVRAPSTLTPSAIFAGGELGLGRILGMAGLGIGGTSQPPSNAKDIALSQGVAPSCYDTVNYSCSSGDVSKMFMISNCGNLTGAQSCDSIGAKAGDGTTPLSAWFRDDALPFLEDLWAQLTGQTDSATELPNPNGHYDVDPKGCKRSVDHVSFSSGNTLTVDRESWSVVKPAPPPQTVQAGYYSADCSGANIADITTAETTTVDTLCIDSVTGKTTDPNGNTLGKTYGVSSAVFDSATQKNKVAFCNASYPNAVLEMVQFRYTNSQTIDDGQPTKYVSTAYSQFWNPDPAQADRDTTENETITTSANCKTRDGQIFAVNRTVKKTAVAAAPNCPDGSTLDTYSITANNGATSTTLDAGGTASGAAAKYPLCLNGSGCSMQVNLDGTPCTASRADCSNWPAVAGATPSRISCQWGTYTMPTSDCYGLSNAYKTETGVVFDPNSGTWTGVDAYGQPVTANPQPWSSTNPNPVAGASAGTVPATGTGTSAIPATGTNPSNGCDAPGWSWNPVEWVHNPVVCALKEAFTPKTDVNARASEIQGIVTTKAPFTFMAPVMTGPSGGGCPNWVVTLPGFSENVVCDSSFTAAIVGARGPMFGLVSAVMVWPLIRSLWYASIPFLRAVPSR